MRHILALRERAALERLASSRVLLAFDYDGTLAPIVDDPLWAPMRRSTRARLERLVEHYPVAVISGRARRDVEHLLGGIEVETIIGNHGLEPSRSARRFARIVNEWRPRLVGLSALPGVAIEDKRFSVAIHYRRSRRRREVLAAIEAVVRTLGDVRVIGGKCVVNVLPIGAPNKGTALEQARRAAHCDTALYAGDDQTDEDVFERARPDRVMTIRVGLARGSHAAYYLRDQREIDRLLSLLIDARRG
jgi:trehalose 6-phosphate phosphatase